MVILRFIAWWKRTPEPWSATPATESNAIYFPTTSCGFNIETLSIYESQDPNSKPADEAARLLVEACSESSSAANDVLADPDFNVNARNSRGKSITHLVLGTANVTTKPTKMRYIATAVQLLCLHHADIDVADDKGLTPLHWCVKTANTLAARHLIEQRVDINAKDNLGRTPLYLLAIDGSPVPEMAQVLIQSGAHLDGKELPDLSGKPKKAQQTVRAMLRTWTR
ncbi:hypothetical protein N0V90_003516 [Kalmusia sp. IMI 367209]|nr:hypothetical protein N0V90_003516 [Kalmusia sp. IMI 367209]